MLPQYDATEALCLLQTTLSQLVRYSFKAEETWAAEEKNSSAHYVSSSAEHTFLLTQGKTCHLCVKL